MSSDHQTLHATHPLCRRGHLSTHIYVLWALATQSFLLGPSAAWPIYRPPSPLPLHLPISPLSCLSMTHLTSRLSLLPISSSSTCLTPTGFFHPTVHLRPGSHENSHPTT